MYNNLLILNGLIRTCIGCIIACGGPGGPHPGWFGPGPPGWGKWRSGIEVDRSGKPLRKEKK